MTTDPGFYTKAADRLRRAQLATIRRQEKAQQDWQKFLADRTSDELRSLCVHYGIRRMSSARKATSLAALLAMPIGVGKPFKETKAKTDRPTLAYKATATWDGRPQTAANTVGVVTDGFVVSDGRRRRSARV